MNERLSISGLTLFVTDIIMWVWLLITLIFAFIGNKVKVVFKIFLIIGCLLLLIVGIAMLYYLWSIASLSATCGFIRELNRDEFRVLDEVKASDNIKKLINTCINTKYNPVLTIQ